LFILTGFTHFAFAGGLLSSGRMINGTDSCLRFFGVALGTIIEESTAFSRARRMRLGRAFCFCARASCNILSKWLQEWTSE
jgi:hypothetical protein